MKSANGFIKLIQYYTVLEYFQNMIYVGQLIFIAIQQLKFFLPNLDFYFQDQVSVNQLIKVHICTNCDKNGANLVFYAFSVQFCSLRLNTMCKILMTSTLSDYIHELHKFF